MGQRELEVHNRTNHLKELLMHKKHLALARVHEYRAAQEQDATPSPSDELDGARALPDVEMHASLIERAEARLRAIDSALNLLEQMAESTPKRRVMNTLAFRNSAVSRRSLRLRPIRRRPQRDVAEGHARDLLPQEPTDQRWLR